FVTVESGEDLFDVLGAYIVLRAAAMELRVGIGEQHLAAARRRLVGIWKLAGKVGPHDQNARRNTRAVEKVWRQADHGLDQVLFEELLPNLFFRTAAKQNAMRHDGRDHTARFAHGKHVLGEHEVALFARGRRPAPAKAFFEFHVAGSVVLAEWRIGNHAVEALQFTSL